MSLLGLVLGLAVLCALVALTLLLMHRFGRRQAAALEFDRRRARHDVAETERQTIQAMLTAELDASRAAAMPARPADVEGSAVDLWDER